MKILSLFKHDDRDRVLIYQNANNSFDFNYSVEDGVDENGKEEPKFKDANESINTDITYEMREVDYYA